MDFKVLFIIKPIKNWELLLLQKYTPLSINSET